MNGQNFNKIIAVSTNTAVTATSASANTIHLRQRITQKFMPVPDESNSD